MGNIKHYFTRSSICNDYRWLCLYKDNIAMLALALNIHTGTPNIDMIYSLHLNCTTVKLNYLKIKRWKI